MFKYLKAVSTQSFMVGLGVAAATYILGPTIKEALRPMAVKGARGMMMLNKKTMEAVHKGKNTLNNMICQQDKPDVAVEQITSLFEQIRQERESSNRLMEDLKNTIDSLREDISNLNNTNTQKA